LLLILLFYYTKIYYTSCNSWFIYLIINYTIVYNLYQSKIRKDIQTKIYEKPYFTVNLFGKEYFGLIKEKKIWPFTTKWLQIMWVEFPIDKATWELDQKYIKSEIKKLKKHYKLKNKSNKWLIFVQLCLLNEIDRFDNISKRPPEFTAEIKQKRLDIRKNITDEYWLKVAFRENMPQANIVYDITKPDEELIKEMNSWCKERVKKAIKKWIEFDVATPDQYDLFYDKRIELSNYKWFNIIPKQQYNDLLKYLIKNKTGNVFTSHFEWDLIAGSICIYDEHRIIYLYWFSNRKYSNIWWHHYLKFKIFGYAREQWMTYVDMLWWAPTWFPKHSLTWVSKFKESLWGSKIEQYWSYDLVINPILYNIFKLYFKRKHK